jgi:16S rRNA (cytosine967-C5)-methyltransferase
MLLSDAPRRGHGGGLPPEGRARAQRLAADTLRNLSRPTNGWRPGSARRRRSPCRNALRLGALELGGRARPPTASSTGVVALVAEGKRTEGFRGLANAVLRSLAAEGPEGLGAPRPPAPARLAAGAAVGAWGEAAVAAMEAAHRRGRPSTCRPRATRRRCARPGRDAPAHRHGAAAEGAQVTALPGYQEGAFWVQDAAAALPARVLAAHAASGCSTFARRRGARRCSSRPRGPR